MKLSVNPTQLKYAVPAAGALALLLRAVLYLTGADGKGLLPSGHWAGIALWILSLVVLAGLFVCTRSIHGSRRYQDCFPVSWVSAAGAFLTALGLAVTAVSAAGISTGIAELAVRILGFAAAAALVAVGLCRMTGAKPPFPCHAALCVYFALRMVYQYRRWSSDPQLQDYCFTLFALMALMLSAYQQAAFDAGIGSHRALWFLSLAAVFLCCPAMYGSRDWVFLLTCGVWAFTNLTVLSGKTRRRRPAMKLDEEPPRDA